MLGNVAGADFAAFSQVARAWLSAAPATAPEGVVAAAADLMRQTDAVPPNTAFEMLLCAYAANGGDSDTGMGANLLLDLWQATSHQPPPRSMLSCSGRGLPHRAPRRGR
jgi:hypothetical protein